MGQSNAERQAAYRARHLKSEDGRGERLNLVVDLHAKACLARLARHCACYAVTGRRQLSSTFTTLPPLSQMLYCLLPR